MKRILAKQTHYKSLLAVVNKHAMVFEGKSGLMKIRTDFEYRVTRISEIIRDINRPVSIFYRVKKIAEARMNESMVKMISMGILSAAIENNEVKMKTMRDFKSQLKKVSAFRLLLNAKYVAGELKNVQSASAGEDFHTEKLPAFIQQVEDFETVLNNLSDQLLRRKMLRKELARLIADTNVFLRESLDAVVRFNSGGNPDFYRDYMVFRKEKKRAHYAKSNLIPEIIPEQKKESKPVLTTVKQLKVALNLDLNKVKESFAVTKFNPGTAIVENELCAEYRKDKLFLAFKPVGNELCEEVMMN